MSSAKGSCHSRGEYNNVDGEDPWLIMVRGGVMQLGPEAGRVGKALGGRILRYTAAPGRAVL